MFKAINNQDNTEIIVLDPAWAERIADLRALSNQGSLVCQGCRQPVRVRAGAVKQRHFAHKHLADCSYGHDSPLLLKLRAILYKRLVAEFGPAVTLEKQVDGAVLPRPVDCWVQREHGAFTYWIVEAALRPQARDALCNALAATNARVHWFFASSMLRCDGNNKKAANLTTTERELIVTTPFDAELDRMPFDTELDGVHFVRGGTLHYLNPETAELTTFRSLRLIHPPQMYQGRTFAAPLSEVLVAKKTGEFAHPGERERLHELQQEKARLEQLAAQRREEERLREEQRRAIPTAWVVPQRNTGLPFAAATPAKRTVSNENDIEKRIAAFGESKEAICMFCGAKTRDWWYYDGATGKCKCRKCPKTGPT